MDREIRFQPLTDGLGFHPFEDGLPYAPASKKQNPNSPGPSQTSNPNYSSGSGANAAGRPQFSYPPQAPTSSSSHPFNSTPVDATAEKIRRELESIQKERIQAAHASVKKAFEPFELHYGFGYSIERAFAFFLDSSFNLALCGSILSTALLSTDLDNLKTLSSGAAITVGVFLFICNWAMLAAQEVAFGTTIGKRIFGLKLNGTGFDCFLRSLYFIPALLFGGLGIVMAIFDSKKRCWHDRMTKIQPS